MKCPKIRRRKKEIKNNLKNRPSMTSGRFFVYTAALKDPGASLAFGRETIEVTE